MTRAVAMLTMLSTKFGFAIPGQLSTAREMGLRRDLSCFGMKRF